MYARDTIPLAGVFSVRLRESPAPCIPYARCRIPRDSRHFAERVLEPDRVLIIEVNDYSEKGMKAGTGQTTPAKKSVFLFGVGQRSSLRARFGKDKIADERHRKTDEPGIVVKRS